MVENWTEGWQDNWQTITVAPETVEIIRREEALRRWRRGLAAGLVIGSGIGTCLGLVIATLL